MEPATGLTILGTAVGSAKILEKLLGPTADYLGDGLKSWTEKRVDNTKRVFHRAAELLGDRVEQPGAVPPKVLKGIMDEGSFCDDELSAAYFGGVLASSRTTISRDDRGASHIALLGRMTTYQIRTHYIFYHTIKSLFDGSGISITTSDGRNKLQAFIPYSTYITAMAFTEAEDAASVVSHVMFGMARECLIEENFQFGTTEHMKNHFPAASQPGILFAPSALGAELFLWAYGMGHVHISEIVSPAIQLPIEDVSIPTGSEPVTKPKPSA